MKITKEITIHTRKVSELSKTERLGYDAAVDACNKAYAPYSGFSVGSALLLSDGDVIQGNNQENAAYPSGLCAERVALFHVKAIKPESTITDAFIVTHSNSEAKQDFAPPCGACLQVFWDIQERQSEPIRVHVRGQRDNEIIFTADSIEQLLPFGFRL